MVDYKGIEKKLGRKLTRQERKKVIDHDHESLSLPPAKKELREKEQRRRTLKSENATRPVQGGAVGQGKRNSGNLLTRKNPGRRDSSDNG
ncbi:MAG: hypothetical protein JJT88_20865 [Gammaproteobacteria bacterium]|nr:hypothetical protein [Gammaproteobacteria bacterium]